MKFTGHASGELPGDVHTSAHRNRPRILARQGAATAGIARDYGQLSVACGRVQIV